LPQKVENFFDTFSPNYSKFVFKEIRLPDKNIVFIREDLMKLINYVDSSEFYQKSVTDKSQQIPKVKIASFKNTIIT